jgi:TolA-binding protein
MSSDEPEPSDTHNISPSRVSSLENSVKSLKADLNELDARIKRLEGDIRYFSQRQIIAVQQGARNLRQRQEFTRQKNRDRDKKEQGENGSQGVIGIIETLIGSFPDHPVGFLLALLFASFFLICLSLLVLTIAQPQFMKQLIESWLL